MRLLAVDTSGPVCGVAVTEDERVLSEFTVLNAHTHSVSLMPMVEQCLQSAGKTLEEMDALAVVTGPGSFTGVRIGVATVKGLAHGSGKRCIPVDALEAMAMSTGKMTGWDGLICPIQDARAGQVYCACFREGSRVTEDRAMKIGDFLREAAELSPGPLLFTGDGVTPHRERILETLGARARLADAPLAYLRPSAAAFLAQASGQLLDYRDLKEYYLRPPNAEKNQKLLEAMRNA